MIQKKKKEAQSNDKIFTPPERNRLLTRLRNWLNNIPIKDPINRQMAVLLQIILVGFMAVLVLAAGVNVFLAETTSLQTIFINTSIFVLGLATLLFFLRRGYFYSTTAIIISVFIFAQSYAILVTSLLEVQSTLTFYTLAILLAGLLINPRALWVVFTINMGVIIFGVIQEQDSTLRLESVSVAGNFFLLNEFGRAHV